ncbi:MAG: hypothetical protein C0490_07950 [Marivirga sp.]|nr:hypothetical protein [Marivirga sp.]
MNRAEQIVWVFLFLIFPLTSFSQVNDFKPKITGQVPSPLTTSENTPITIGLNNLIVTDQDPLPVYPTGFTLSVSDGNNYETQGHTIIPDNKFSGMLTVSVRVKDGKHESDRFDLNIQVTKSQNVDPTITGQQPLSIAQGQSFTITLGHLIVSDPDNNYPADFTLKVFTGNNYTVNGNTITPFANFSGSLKVPVSVNDGKDESKRFDLKIEVIKNAVPVITGQQTLSTSQGQAFTITLNQLIVTDSDNNYPADFTLKVFDDNNYTVNANTITPSANFSGTLKVPVTVNDGKNESNKFDLKIEVVKDQNTAPKITGQVPLSTTQGTSISISFASITVTDPDNIYPTGFTLKISNGNNYVATGNTVTPSPSFTGELKVNITVNDGKASSPVFQLKIEVTPSPSNVPPVITGQKEISITQNTSVTLQLAQLIVTDPDNTYPNGFVLKVFPGNSYTVNGTTVTPVSGFTNNTLSVTVRVNDGISDSAPFNVKIAVIPLTARPKINGQKELSTMEDSTILISLSDLIVTDADDPGYPTGFSLIVLRENEDIYTVTRNTITPVLNLNGFIEVDVMVSDGVNKSDVFKLSILVKPVNDAPEILNMETNAVSYEPGNEPLPLFESLDLRDVDSEYLSMAEVGFRQPHYSPVNDELIASYDSSFSSLRIVFDQEGILFLIGYATVDEYRKALRSIKYNYRITRNESGAPMEIATGSRTIYMTVSDGQQVSSTYEKQINLETKILMDIPNAFTPNGDHSNDTWHLDVTNKEQLKTALIRVYSKRGEILYESTGFEKEWDGRYNGQVLPVDTYYYTIEINLPYIRKTFKGVVTVLY